MKPLLVVAPLAALLLAACGTDSCQSQAAQANTTSPSCTLAPTVQQCQGNLGCDITGCNAQVPQATCQVTLPAVSGIYPLVVVGQTVVQGTLTLGGRGGATCNL